MRFFTEDFADNAFAYLSTQLMKPGERDDGWHTDGGTSLLHASVTLFGTRELQVRALGQDGQDRVVTLAQRPGSFYVTCAPWNTMSQCAPHQRVLEVLRNCLGLGCNSQNARNTNSRPVDD